MLFITNKMPNLTGNGTLTMKPVDTASVSKALATGFISLVSESATAQCLTTLLGVQVPIGTLQVTPKIGEDTVILVNVNGTVLKDATTFASDTTVQFHVLETNKPMVDTRAMKLKVAQWLVKDL